MTRQMALRLFTGTLLIGAAATLAGCETTATGSQAAAAKVEPPMTRTRAAEQCWMATEKGNPNENLDKRADLVNKCIDEKMKAAPAAGPSG